MSVTLKLLCQSLLYYCTSHPYLIVLFILPWSTISRSFLYYFPCQIPTIVSETVILLPKWAMYYFTSHSDTILWVSLMLLCESHIYYSVNGYYFIVQFIYLPMYPATLILLCHVTLIIFYQSFSYCSVSRIYTLVLVTLIPLSTIHILL